MSLRHGSIQTLLELPVTVEYVFGYRKSHSMAIFRTAKNDEQVFNDVCEYISPPVRVMRWFCSMFKTGPIARVINGLYRSQQILTFCGIRKSESVSRSFSKNHQQYKLLVPPGQVLYNYHSIKSANCL